MPITTVTKMTGAVTVLMSCRNASASHFASVAGPGATSPNTMPAAIATSTQNHSCRFMEASSSRLSTRGTPPRAKGERTARSGPLSCLWSLWSKVSLWSRGTPESWDHAAMRVRSLAGRLLVLQLTVVAVTVAAGALITVLVARERTETAARDRSLTVARTVAALPEIPQALDAARPERDAPAAGRALRTEARVSFITIMRPDGIRYTHPTPSLIGKRFVGTFEPAARGQTVTETTTGTLGRSVRAVVPVRENGEIVALVGVGVLTEAIGDEVAALLPGVHRLRGADPGHRQRAQPAARPPPQAPDARPRAAGDRDAVRPPRRHPARAARGRRGVRRARPGRAGQRRGGESAGRHRHSIRPHSATTRR